MTALAWQHLGDRADSLLIPTFTETFDALIHLLATAQLWKALWVSNQALVLGFALAAATGVSLGLLMSRWTLAEKVADPYLSILLVTPMSAVIPIVIMAAGVGLASRVVVIFTFAFVTIAVNTRAGIRMIEPEWIEMTRAFGASERQLWLRILLRGASPAILMGLRVGLMRAVSGMVTIELLLIAAGVGRLVLDFEGRLDAANMYATVAVIIAEAVLLARFCQKLEVRASPWVEPAVTE